MNVTGMIPAVGWRAIFVYHDSDALEDLVCFAVVEGSVEAMVYDKFEIRPARTLPGFVGILSPRQPIAIFEGRIIGVRLQMIERQLGHDFDYIDEGLIRQIVLEEKNYKAAKDRIVREEVRVLHEMLSAHMKNPPSEAVILKWSEQMFHQAGEWATLMSIAETGEEKNLLVEDITMPEFLFLQEYNVE